MNAISNRTVVACLLLGTLPGLALAGGRTTDVDAIAQATGLSCSEVQMLVGARTPHPEYFTSFDRAQRRMESVLGKERARALMAGREIVLDDGRRVALAQR